MGLFDWVKQKGSDMSNELKKLANKDFMESIAAACAVVALADGSVNPAEKQKMIGFISINENLKVFKVADIIEKFNFYIQQFEFDFNIGKIESFKAIEKQKTNINNAKMLIAVCISIASSDGNFDTNEVNVIAEICTRLGVNPNEFNLSPTKKQI